MNSKPSGAPSISSAIAGLACADGADEPHLQPSPTVMAIANLTPSAATSRLVSQGKAGLRDVGQGRWRQWDRAGEEQVVADVRPNRVELQRDPLGVRPLYYATSPDADRLAWATHPSQLAAVPWVDTSPHWDRLLDVVSGSPPADPRRTCMVGVRQVQPGHRLAWRPGHVEEVRYWNPADHLWDGEPAKEDAVAQFAELLQDALGRRVDRPAALFLSGGIDSPTLACAAVRGGLPVHAVSAVHPYFPSADESANIRAVLDALALEGDMVDDDGPADFGRDVELALHGEPHGAASHAVYHGLVRAAAQRGYTLAIDGCDGDSALGYLDGIGQYTFSRPRLCFGCWRFIRRATGVEARVLARTWLRDISPAAATLLGRGMSRARPSTGQADSRAPLGSWKAELVSHQRARTQQRRSWRETQLLAAGPFLSEAIVLMDRVAEDCGVEAVHPFADRGLIEFLLAQPPEVKHIGGQWKGLARAAFPELPACVRGAVRQVDITPVVNAQYPLTRLAPMLADPAVPVPFVDYEALRGRLASNAPYEPGELSQLRALALVHRFLEGPRSR